MESYFAGLLPAVEREKECALAHSRAERGRLRHASVSRECASLAEPFFCVIGIPTEFPITQKTPAGRIPQESFAHKFTL